MVEYKLNKEKIKDILILSAFCFMVIYILMNWPLIKILAVFTTIFVIVIGSRFIYTERKEIGWAGISLMIFIMSILSFFSLGVYYLSFEIEANIMERNRDRDAFYSQYNDLSTEQQNVISHIKELENEYNRSERFRGLTKGFVDLSRTYNKNPEGHELDILKLNLETINDANEIVRRR